MAGMDRVDGPEAEVEIRRSTRRRRTVSARVEGDRVVVLMPAGLTAEQEQEHVTHLLQKLRRSQQRHRLQREDLMSRAQRLSRDYLGGRAQPASVSWVTNQNSRWGSCTAGAGTIRISSLLEGMPDWVVDAVLVHELAHLLQADHGPRFQQLVGRYPRYVEARAFLDGVSWASGRRGLGLDGDAGADGVEQDPVGEATGGAG